MGPGGPAQRCPSQAGAGKQQGWTEEPLGANGPGPGGGHGAVTGGLWSPRELHGHLVTGQPGQSPIPSPAPPPQPALLLTCVFILQVSRKVNIIHAGGAVGFRKSRKSQSPSGRHAPAQGCGHGLRDLEAGLPSKIPSRKLGQQPHAWEAGQDCWGQHSPGLQQGLVLGTKQRLGCSLEENLPSPLTQPTSPIPSWPPGARTSLPRCLQPPRGSRGCPCCPPAPSSAGQPCSIRVH